MRVVCIFNEGINLSNKTLDVVYREDSIFFLKINEQYSVYGMAVWVGVLHYLVIDIWGLPSWFPAQLFAVLDDAIPATFHFKFYRKYEISAVWGYKELLDEQHYDRLIERQDDDLKIFFLHKEIIDQSESIKHKNIPPICSILQRYYEGNMIANKFIEEFNLYYINFFSKDLNKKYQTMFDALYAITQTYKPISDHDENLKKSIQKLYFSINFPEVQFKHQ